MNTPMLKRRLNPFLLASTVLVLSLLAGMSVMYQGQLSNLVQDRKTLNEEINQKNQQITQLENETATLETRLSTAQSDTESLTRRVNDLESQVNSLESDKQTLESRLQRRDAELTDVKNERDSLQSRVDNLEDQRDTAISEVLELSDWMEDVCAVDDDNLTDDGDDACGDFDEDDYNKYRD